MKLIYILNFLLFIGLSNAIAQRVYVDQNATGAGDGSSWTDAYTDLKSTLDSAGVNSLSWEIWVKSGTYILGASAESFNLASEGLKVYGGFDGTESNLTQRDWRNNPTILSGDVNQNDTGLVDINNPSMSDNAATVVFMVPYEDGANETILDGFIIEGGKASSASPGPGRYGAGIYIEPNPTGTSMNAVAMVRNCIIRNNAAHFNSGIYVFGDGRNAQLRVESCEFRENTSRGTVAGAISNNAFSSALFANCLFTKNTFTDRGTVFSNGSFSATPSFIFPNGIFLANTTVVDNFFVNPSGGSIFQVFSPLPIDTLGNKQASLLAVYNSIIEFDPSNEALIHGNPAGDASQDTILFKNCLISDSIVAENVLSPVLIESTYPVSDFGFNDAAAGDFSLTSSSIGYQAGNFDYYAEAYEVFGLPGEESDLDFLGNPRYIPNASLAMDMGAYESVVSGISQLEAETVGVYPNPAKQEIALNGKFSKYDKVQLIDFQGMVRKEWTEIEGKMDISDLNSGIYMLRISSANETQSLKLLIE